MRRWNGVGCSAVAVMLACAALGAALPATAQTDKSPAKGREWSTLSAQDQHALLPLKQDWHLLDAARQRKWLEVVSRFGKMPADERARIQERMAEWAAATPAQRATARLQFQEARQFSPDERQARWEAYQALPDEQRRALAERAVPTGKPVGQNAEHAQAPASPVTAKNNLVRLQVPALRAVSPAIVQAKPGATTTTVSTRPSPPAHHHAGLPKIAATAEFVDPATLLPRRGPQAAATLDAAPVPSDPDKGQ